MPHLSEQRLIPDAVPQETLRADLLQPYLTDFLRNSDLRGYAERELGITLPRRLTPLKEDQRELRRIGSIQIDLLASSPDPQTEKLYQKIIALPEVYGTEGSIPSRATLSNDQGKSVERLTAFAHGKPIEQATITFPEALSQNPQRKAAFISLNSASYFYYFPEGTLEVVTTSHGIDHVFYPGVIEMPLDPHERATFPALIAHASYIGEKRAAYVLRSIGTLSTGETNSKLVDLNKKEKPALLMVTGAEEYAISITPHGKDTIAVKDTVVRSETDATLERRIVQVATTATPEEIVAALDHPTRIIHATQTNRPGEKQFARYTDGELEVGVGIQNDSIYVVIDDAVYFPLDASMTKTSLVVQFSQDTQIVLTLEHGFIVEARKVPLSKKR
jgi:hypothetical protein